MNFEDLKQWFTDYADSFQSDNEEKNQSHTLKKEHTFRVLDEMIDLALNLNLNSEDTLIAKTIALFHDVGRFKQFEKYGTFSDAKSENHSKIALEVLEENNLLKDFSSPHKKWIKQAISYHNTPRLPLNLEEKLNLFSCLIRDADKLDIWKIVISAYKQEDNNPAITLHLPDDARISDSVFDAILAKKPVKYSELETVNDFKLLQASWVYDLNFTHSCRSLKQRNYLDIIFDTLPQIERVEILKELIMNELERKILI